LTVNVPSIAYWPNTTSIVGTLIHRNIENAMVHWLLWVNGAIYLQRHFDYGIQLPSF
jgi:hypothetical protein